MKRDIYLVLVVNLSLDVDSISTERHRAEVRRALNDERLYTIADT